MEICGSQVDRVSHLLVALAFGTEQFKSSESKLQFMEDVQESRPFSKCFRFPEMNKSTCEISVLNGTLIVIELQREYFVLVF
jgi:hypothetical protein